MTREIDTWRSLTPFRTWVYRLSEVDGAYLLERKLEGQPDAAFTPCVKGDGHTVARRIADLLAHEDVNRNVSKMRRTR